MGDEGIEFLKSLSLPSDFISGIADATIGGTTTGKATDSTAGKILTDSTFCVCMPSAYSSFKFGANIIPALTLQNCLDGPHYSI